MLRLIDQNLEITEVCYELFQDKNDLFDQSIHYEEDPIFFI